jgi:hypothetical protein
MNQEMASSSSDDDGSDDSNLYYEFNSDNESAIEHASLTTKSTSLKKGPMIIDITPPSML